MSEASTSAQDVVGVFKVNGGEQVFQNARTMRVDARRDSKMPEHPLEDGSSVVDNRVMLPAEGQLFMVLGNDEYRDLYSVIKSFMVSGELLTLQTKADTFNNIAIENISHQEDAEMMDAITLVMRVKEVIFFKKQVQAVAPRSTKSQTTTKRGEQAGRQSSVAYDIFVKK